MASSVDQKRLKATKFPPEFDKKVDIEKVNIDLMKKWIANRITTILGDEDDIVVETCYNLIEQSQFPKIKEIQIQLTGFLNKDTAPFCKELWDLMLSAQDSPMGVPRELLEAKKAELQQEQLSKAAADARRAEEQAQNAMIDSFRQSERSDRPERGRGGGGRYRGSDRRGRGRDFDRGIPRRERDSRSPPRRRPSPPTRERDISRPPALTFGQSFCISTTSSYTSLTIVRTFSIPTTQTSNATFPVN
ncbi:uncharacterized protein ALTATR162_LOCUS7171 [Alternaria atra]|uniref:PWI domain-containing protein n=1 Tax=Alternaria atra TaxID=119953 RepID=A0A8J2I3Q6_9PLEO|nr:uncharacterized protein ALTATR162_LOCUS7171 [Alternaria atra]CAG5170345.1 unnamed protein product [Alternaria atra]